MNGSTKRNQYLTKDEHHYCRCWCVGGAVDYAVFDQYSSVLSRADSVYEDMKQRYGHQGCYLLKMNSRTFSAEEDEQIPDPLESVPAQE